MEEGGGGGDEYYCIAIIVSRDVTEEGVVVLISETFCSCTGYLIKQGHVNTASFKRRSEG